MLWQRNDNLEKCGGAEMKKIYCMKCGQEVNIKFGMVPNRCICGAEFNEWNKNTVINTVLCIIALLLLISPLFVIVYFTRKFLRDSIILYAIMLVAFIICFRQAEGILIRIGVLKMKNIEIR